MQIRAPLSGIAVALDRVPDPVFAQRMVGDGAGIDPTSSEVLAPFDGKVTQFHAAGHAVAVTSADGVEVLIHVGIDTVALKGAGFTALVKLGAAVRAGQPLLRFDADAIARKARSLVTVVLVTTMDGRTVDGVATGLVEAGKTSLFTVGGAETIALPEARESGPSTTVRSAPVTLPNANGLHARPAAVLAQTAKQFLSSVSLLRGEASANVKSVVGVMGLSTRFGDEVVLSATGPDAAQAVAALEKVLREGSGETPATAAAPVAAASSPPVVARTSNPPANGTYEGVPAAPGLALGRVTRLQNASIDVPQRGGSLAQETAKFDAARTEASSQLSALSTSQRSNAAILEVQRELLEDPALLSATKTGLDAGQSAAFAWQRAYLQQAATFEGLDQAVLRERAVDVRDVGLRLLRVLTGTAAAVSSLPDNAIVVVEELTPTQLAGFDVKRFKGLVTTTGSATSHVAILARGMGVPTVMGVDASVLSLPEGLEVVLDGTAGTLARAPAPDDTQARARLDEQLNRLSAERETERTAAFQRGQTRDGRRIEVVANIKNLDDARAAMAGGAEGVGLLRSEFLFFDRASAPDEREQAQVYRAIAEVVGPDRPLVVRTLDVGGDKPLPYMPLPKEENPFLGLRGIRVSLDQPEMFLTQLRAMAAASSATKLHVMFPMIASVEELRAARALLTEAWAGRGGAVKVGIMVEVPSAVMMAEALAREADFFSIGTNDLTQYALAMDRGHPKLAKQADALHPAVLKLIAMTCEGARVHQRPVHVCGGIASDPLAAPVLIGMGVTELSVSTPSVGAVKAAIARWSFAECEALAEEVLHQSTTAEVRALLKARQPGRLRNVTPIAANR